MSEGCVVSELHFYPVKGCRGIALSSATLLPEGIQYDRSFMVIDEQNNMVSQRQERALATINCSFESGLLTLESKQGKTLRLPIDGLPRSEGSTPVSTIVHGSAVSGFDQGDEAAAWFTEAIASDKGKPFRLVHINAAVARDFANQKTIVPRYNTFFADGFPYLVTNRNSLTKLNSVIEVAGDKAVSMDRFRPNIVLDGLEPFAEDRIERFLFKDSTTGLECVFPSGRCVVTTIDQKTGEKGAQPLVAMNEFRKGTTTSGKEGVLFGENAILFGTRKAALSIGEKLIPVWEE